MKRDKSQRHSLKIMAIFFAVSLWFYVLNSEPIQIEKKLAINYIAPKGFMISNSQEHEVIVKLKGSKGFVKNIFSNKEKLNIDLNSHFISSGRSFKVKFYPSDVNVPFGVEVLDISPKEVLIELDRKTMLEVPIEVQYIGTLPKNRKLKEVTVMPLNVTITGPLEVIKTVLKVETLPVNLHSFNKDLGQMRLVLSKMDPRLKIEEMPDITLKYKTQLINLK